MVGAKGWIRDILSPFNLWSAFTWVCPAAGAAVSATLSYLKGLPPSVTLLLAVMTAACVTISYDFARKWFDRRNTHLLKIEELEARLRPPSSDIEVTLDGVAYESIRDENDNLLPPCNAFLVRLTNRGDKFLTNCQIMFGMGHISYPVSKCFDLRRGEHKVFPILRTKTLSHHQFQFGDSDDRFALMYFLSNDTWKISADGLTLLIAPGMYQVRVWSADTGAAVLDVNLTKGADWKLEAA